MTIIIKSISVIASDSEAISSGWHQKMAVVSGLSMEMVGGAIALGRKLGMLEKVGVKREDQM